MEQRQGYGLRILYTLFSGVFNIFHFKKLQANIKRLLKSFELFVGVRVGVAFFWNKLWCVYVSRILIHLSFLTFKFPRSQRLYGRTEGHVLIDSSTDPDYIYICLILSGMTFSFVISYASYLLFNESSISLCPYIHYIKDPDCFLCSPYLEDKNPLD